MTISEDYEYFIIPVSDGFGSMLTEPWVFSSHVIERKKCLCQIRSQIRLTMKQTSDELMYAGDSCFSFFSTLSIDYAGKGSLLRCRFFEVTNSYRRFGSLKREISKMAAYGTQIKAAHVNLTI